MIFLVCSEVITNASNEEQRELQNIRIARSQNDSGYPKTPVISGFSSALLIQACYSPLAESLFTCFSYRFKSRHLMRLNALDYNLYVSLRRVNDVTI